MRFANRQQKAECYNCKYSEVGAPASQLSMAHTHEFVGEWLSLVEHLVRDQGVGGSNPLSPTIFF
jgi:hypothetical protein